MAVGGKRPGAGRPRKSVKYAGQVAAAEDAIADRLPELIANLFALAAGVTVQAENRDGTTRVYTEPPNFKANEYLINRILGRPTEHHEVTGDDGDAIEINATVRDRAAEELDAWRRQMTARLSLPNAQPIAPTSPTHSV